MKHTRIRIARAYDPPSDEDGARFLVDRIWPRGKSKEDLRLERWSREVAPSNELRKFFCHDLAHWDEFTQRYREELDSNEEALQPLIEAAKKGPVTLVYGARDAEHNQAAVLRDYLAAKLAGR
jgi:uncharacterized protein YeaO (DUF488 family)